MTFSLWFGGAKKGGQATDSVRTAAHKVVSNSEYSASKGAPIHPQDLRIPRLNHGDEDAFASIFREYASGLLTFAWRKIGSRSIAEEIVQDVFLDIWERREALSPDIILRSYLYQAVRYRIQNQYRASSVEKRYEERLAVDQIQGAPGLPGSFASSEDLLHATELREMLTAAIDQIPPRSREVFLLNRENYLSYAEIAKTLGISVKTVEVHMGKALAILRMVLKDSI